MSTLHVHDFWLDEFHSLINSAAHRGAFRALPEDEFLRDVPRYTDLGSESSVASVWRGMRCDTHPPTFFVLLYGWRRLFGTGEVAVRLPAAIFSVLSILPIAVILRRCGHAAAGLAAALLLGFAHSHIAMGQQARPYSLAMLLVGVGYWLLIVMEQRWSVFTTPRRAGCIVAYALVLCLAVLTHYFSGLVLLGQVPYALLRFRGSLLRWWAGGLTAAVLLFAALWLPSLLAQVDFIAAQEFVFTTTEQHVWHTLLRAADLPVRLLLRYPQYDWSTVSAASVALVGMLGLGAAFMALWRARCRAAVIFAFWYVTPCLGLIGIDLLSGAQLLVHLRYPSLLGPAIAALLVLAVGQLRRPLVLLAAVAAAVGVAVTLRLPATQNPQGRAAAQVLAEHIRPGDLLVFDTIGWLRGWARDEFVQVSYYLPPDRHTILLLNAPPRPETIRHLRDFERVFVISPRMGELPNPSPDTHRPYRSWGYFRDIGFVHWLQRRGTEPAADAGFRVQDSEFRM